MLLANAGMAALLYGMSGRLESWMVLSAWERGGRLALCIVAAAATYFAMLFVVGLRLRHVRNVAGA